MAYLKCVQNCLNSLKKMPNCIGNANITKKLNFSSVSNIGSDIVEFTSARSKIMQKYRSGINDTLYVFTNDGQILTLARKNGSDDLKFLEHIKNGIYQKPITQKAGTAPISDDAVKNSNNLAKEIIGENDRFIDGTRYNGVKAKFDISGKNISRFSDGGGEIIIVDRKNDKLLNETINAFKMRLQGKNLSDEQKMQELLKFSDEIFSVEKSGTNLEQLVKNMMNVQNPQEVYLGQIINSGAGVCRHRALLTKILGDEIGLKTRFISGQYNAGGHAWNEIILGKKTYLFDAMHGNIFDVSDVNKMPFQTFHYKITDPQNNSKLIAKYFDVNSKAGLMYRYQRNGMKIPTSYGDFIPCDNGYLIQPNSDKILLNGKIISSPTIAKTDDWISINDKIGFSIL